jgi:DNA-directed RNA polymerase subunit RPC12/RpoP
MGITNIIKCTKCQGFILAEKDQKTKTCPYCSTKVNLSSAQKVASANTAMEASEILKHLKSEKGFIKD